MKTVYTWATIFLFITFASNVNANTYRCQYNNGVVVESKGICPRGTINLGTTTRSSERGRLGGNLSEGWDSTGRSIANSMSQVIQGNRNSQPNAGANAVQSKLNVIKEIDQLLESGSISKDMADQLKAQALR